MKDMAPLLDPRSNITAHLRRVFIRSKDADGISEDRLKMLIAALPPDQLLAFDCFHKISQLTLHLLLKCQRILKRLQLIDVAELMAHKDSAMIQPLLSNVAIFSMDVPRTRHAHSA